MEWHFRFPSKRAIFTSRDTCMLNIRKVTIQVSSPQLTLRPVCPQPKWACIGVLPGQQTKVLQKAFSLCCRC
jgi:hypothetical protein